MDDGGGGGGGGDTQPPVISNVFASSITDTSAVITWTTNEASTSQVEYGLTTGYGSSTPFDSTRVISHSVTLAGLSAGTTYHYRVKSRDAAGNESVSGDNTFTTETYAFQESGGQVVFESENYYTRIPRNGQNWEFSNSEVGYTGAGYLQPLPDSGSNILSGYEVLSPEVQYLINFSTPGTYYIWIRGKWIGSGVFMHGGINSTTPTSAASIWGPINWGTWRNQSMYNERPTLDVPTAGIHTFNLWMQEDGYIVDKILLTTDPNFTPSGDGPAESTRLTVPPDVTAPLINNIQSFPVSHNVTITWETDEPATSRVEYGLTPSYGMMTPAYASRVVNHSLFITELQPNTLYHYRVISQDRSGNEMISGDMTFETFASLEGPAFQESGGQVVMEAENYDARISRNSQNWEFSDTRIGYTGIGYLQPLPDIGSNILTNYDTLSPEVQYRIHFSTAGTYYIWIRGKWIGSGVYMHGGIDGTTPATAVSIKGPINWEIWRSQTASNGRPTLEVPTAGIHTFNLWMQEDGYIVDKILLTTDPNFAPYQRWGPDESPRSDVSFETWLLSQQVPNDIVPSPHPGREGLLVSFDIPTTDPLYSILGNRSYTYDDAVGAVAMTLGGDFTNAARILTALSNLTHPEGKIAFSFNTANSFVHNLYKTGTVAWAGYAMALYQKKSGDTQFQVTAQKIADYLLTLQDTNPTSPSYGSLRAEPGVTIYPTEHNIDAYFFLREIGSLTGNAAYLNAATRIENGLLSHHWNTDHFDQAVGDLSNALDASSWGAIFLQAIGETAMATDTLSYVEATFRNTKTITGTTETVTGYAPYGQDVVWAEGTFGVATAYRKLGQDAAANGIVAEMMKLQGPNGGIFYAMPRTTVVTGDTFQEWESVASTGWLLIERSASEFWTLSPIPKPEFLPITPPAGAEGSLLSFTVSATGGGTLTYSAENLPAGATFNAGTKTFSWTPDYDQNGVYEVYFVVSDGVLEDMMSVFITIADTPIANSAPTIDPIPNQLAGPNMTLNFSVYGRDPNTAEGVTLSASGLPTWLLVQSNTPGNPAVMILSGNPGSDPTVSYTLTFTAQDNGMPPLDASRQVTLTIDRSPPPKPTLNPVTSPTNVNPYVLSGTKQANTSIWINGAEAIPLTSGTGWSYAYSLAEGENILSITAKDAVLNQSAPTSTSILYFKINTPLPDQIVAGGIGDQKNNDVAIFRKNVYLVWEDAGTGEVLFNRSQDGGLSWEEAPLVLGTGTNPRVTVDGLGRVYGVWSEGAINAPGPIRVRKSDDGGTSFGAAVQAGNGYVPAITTSEEGSLVYVAFHHKAGSETRVSCARSTDGGQTFGAAVQASEIMSVDNVIAPTEGLDISTSPDGQYVWIGFSRLYVSQGKVVLARSTDSGLTFEPANTVLNPESHNGNRPRFAFVNGFLFVVFRHNSFGENHIYVRKSTDFGTTWAPKVKVDDGEPSSTDYVMPSITADANGCIYVAFINETEGGEKGAYIDSSVDGGETFGFDTRIDTPPDVSYAVLPAVASSSDGNIRLVVWEDRRSGDSDLYAWRNPDRLQVEWLMSQLGSFGFVDSIEGDAQAVGLTRDQSFAAKAFARGGELPLAQRILNGLSSLQNEDGSWYLSYDVGSGAVTDLTLTKDVEAVAWVVSAINYYTLLTNDDSFIPVAERAAAFILNHFDLNPASVTAGSVLAGERNGQLINERKITHAALCCTVLKTLSTITGSPSYLSTSEMAKHFLVHGVYNGTRFRPGWTDTSEALSPNSYAVLSLGANPDGVDLAPSVNWSKQTLAIYADWPDRNLYDLHGLDENNSQNLPLDKIWTGGTEQIATSFQMVGDTANANYFHAQTNRMMQTDGGVPLATPNADGLEWTTLSTVSSTSMSYFSNAVPQMNAFEVTTGLVQTEQLDPLFLKRWLLLGPFPFTTGTELTAHITDTIGETTIRPNPGLSTGGKVWAYHESEEDYIDFDMLFTPHDEAVAYAAAYIYSPIAQTVTLKLGSSDAVKVWMNGVLVHDHFILRSAQRDQDLIPVDLQIGWNRLLLKILVSQGPWGFYARFSNFDGSPIEGLIAQTGDPVLNQYPVIQSSSPPAYSTFIAGDPVAMSVDAYDMDAGDTLSFRMLANGVEIRPWNSNSAFSWVTTTSDVRDHLLRIEVQDNRGGFSSVSIPVKLIDGTAPPPPSVSPVISPTTLPTQTLSGGRFDETTEILVNGSSIGVTYPSALTWSYAASLIQGRNEFRIASRDLAGNTSAPVLVTIDYVVGYVPLPEFAFADTPDEEKNADLAISGETIYAVWENATTGDILFDKSPGLGASWNNDRKVIGQGRTPRIKVDGDGQIYVVWIDSPNPTTQGPLYFTTSNDGGTTFTAPAVLANGYHAEVAASLQGEYVYVMNIETYAGSASSIYVLRSLDGGGAFEPPVLMRGPETGYSTYREGALETTEDGRYVFGVLTQHCCGGWGSRYKVYLFRSGDYGQSFGSGKNLTPEEHNGGDPRLIVFADRLYAFWRRDQNQRHHIFMRKSLDFGVTWTPATVYPDDRIDDGDYDITDYSLPDIAVDGSGRLYAAFVDYSDYPADNPDLGQVYDIYFDRSTDEGETWDVDTRVDDSIGASAQTLPSIVVDESGESIFAVWEDDRSGNGDLYAKQILASLPQTETAYDWLKERIGSFGFVDSFEGDVQSVGTTRDQALAAIVFSRSGEMTSAKRLLSALAALQNPDGSWYTSYDANSGISNDPYLEKRTEDAAWVILAVSHYGWLSGDKSFLPMAELAASWLLNQQDMSGTSPTYGAVHAGEKQGIALTDILTVENELAYAALNAHGDLARNNSYRERAGLIKAFLLGNLWDGAKFVERRGVTNGAVSANALGVLALGPSAGGQNLLNGLTWTENNAKLFVDWPSRGLSNLEGFDTTPPPVKIASVETAEMVGAYGVAGNTAQRNRYHNEMSRYQDPNGGIPFATPNVQGVTSLNAFTSTAWFYFNETGINPLIISRTPGTGLIIDDFQDLRPNSNRLGFYTDDDRTAAIDRDLFGVHEIGWDNLRDYWYTNLRSEDETIAWTDATNYTKVSFNIKGDSGGERLYIRFQDFMRNVDVDLANYATLTASWQEVSIPIQDFVEKGLLANRLKAFILYFNLQPSGKVLIDDIRLSGERPMAVAGPDQTVALGDSVSFSGAGSWDPDGTITSYKWDFGDGTTATGVTVSHLYGEEGIYTVRLTVTDSDKAKDEDTAVITVGPPVIPPNQPPVINSVTPADNSVFVEGETRLIAVSASDPESDPLQYRFTLDAAIVQNWGAASQYTWNIAPGAFGDHTMTIEVKDAGATVNTVVTYHVQSASAEAVLQTVSNNVAPLLDIKGSISESWNYLGNTDTNLSGNFWVKRPDKMRVDRTATGESLVMNGTTLYLTKPATGTQIIETSLYHDVLPNALDLIFHLNDFRASHHTTKIADSGGIATLEALPEALNQTYDKVQLDIETAKGLVKEIRVYGKSGSVILRSTVTASASFNASGTPVWLPTATTEILYFDGNPMTTQTTYSGIQVNTGISDGTFTP